MKPGRNKERITKGRMVEFFFEAFVPDLENPENRMGISVYNNIRPVSKPLYFHWGMSEVIPCWE